MYAVCLIDAPGGWYRIGKRTRTPSGQFSSFKMVCPGTAGARTKALENFKNGTVRILVATDIAARGLDIYQLPQVVNFDLPHVKEDYVHRMGRTGRAGAAGEAISLVCADEFQQLADIERLIKELLTREYV